MGGKLKSIGKFYGKVLVFKGHGTLEQGIYICFLTADENHGYHQENKIWNELFHGKYLISGCDFVVYITVSYNKV